MKISYKFRTFLAFPKFFLRFFSKSRDNLSFPAHFCEIPAFCCCCCKIHQKFAEKSSLIPQNANFSITQYCTFPLFYRNNLSVPSLSLILENCVTTKKLFFKKNKQSTQQSTHKQYGTNCVPTLSITQFKQPITLTVFQCSPNKINPQTQTQYTLCVPTISINNIETHNNTNGSHCLPKQLNANVNPSLFGSGAGIFLYGTSLNGVDKNSSNVATHPSQVK